MGDPRSAVDRFAFLASDLLNRRTRETVEAQRLYDERVVGAVHDRHPSARPVWSIPPMGSPLDRRAIGFEDAHPHAEPPPGLARAASRNHLRPARGQRGQQWRDLLIELANRPRLTPVWSELGVDTAVMGAGATSMMVRYPSVLLEIEWPDDPMWLCYALERPRSCEHLIPVPVSEFYAACEASDARRERVAAGVRGPGGDGG